MAQLNRDELQQAYRSMRTIRAFEKALEHEVATAPMPGVVHLYIGEEALGGRRVHEPR